MKRSKKLLHKPQTSLGIIILICLIFLSALSALRAVTTDVRSLEQLPSTPPSTILSGIVLDTTDTASGSAISATNSAKSATTAAQVATASATPAPTIASSLLRLRVKKDQTFWEFAKRYCGSHTYAERLARANGYKRVTDLKEGDWITISCR